MIVTELSKGTKLYLLVGGRGTRLSSVSNGVPKPLIDIHGKPFIQRVIENLSGFDITLVCSNLNYHHFKDLDLDVDVFNEGEPCGTGGFLRKINVPDVFYVMNGDTYHSGDINLDTEDTTIFVSKRKIKGDEGYVVGAYGMVNHFVEKNPCGAGRTELVNVGIYKFYRRDIDIPYTLPRSIEYDILNEIDLSYKVLHTREFDIGTPERLETFRNWTC